MIINGLRRMIPFCIDSEHITGFMPDDNPNEIWIRVYLGGQTVNLDEDCYVIINGVKVRCLGDNVVKIAEYLQTILTLERSEPQIDLLQQKIEELSKINKQK